MSRTIQEILKRARTKNTFFCFSPPVMAATFVIEIALAIYTFIKYKANSFVRAAIGTLCLLATFQLAEYQICEGSDPAMIWAKIGFIAITILPVLGIYLVGLISKTKIASRLTEAGVIISAAFIFCFLISPDAVTASVCGGNYVIFSAIPALYWLYSLYYFLFLAAALYEAMKEAAKHKEKIEKKETMRWLVIGYASFLLPMTVVYLIYPETLAGIPSIMCGFAVFFAFILTFKVVPKVRH